MFKFYVALLALLPFAAGSGSLDEYRKSVWTDVSVDSLLDEFSHLLHCESDTADLKCSMCLSANATHQLGDPLESNQMAVYLLNLYINKSIHCRNSNVTYHYDQLVKDLDIDSSTEETLHTSVWRLLQKVNTSHIELEKEEENYDDTHVVHLHQAQDSHTDEGHDEDEHHALCFGLEMLLHEYENEPSKKDAAEDFAYLIVNHLLAGDKFTADCEVKPFLQDFTSDILHQLAVPENASHISFHDLEKLVESVRETQSDSAAGQESPTDDDHSSHAHKRSLHTEDDHENLVEKCLTTEEIAESFGIEHEGEVPVSMLPKISLAVVQQMAGGYCVHPAELEPSYAEPTPFQKWGISTISVAIISSLALLGGLLFPCLNYDFVQDILTLFIGLAIGTMAGDALLHLIPQAVDLHAHEDGHTSDAIVVEEYVGKMLVVVAAIYVFFLFETVMAKFGHSHLGNDDDFIHSKEHGKCTDKGVVPHAETMENIHNAVVYDGESKYNGKSNGYTISTVELTSSKETLPDDIESMKNHKKHVTWFKLPTVAYMVIAGDALHNFVDGLAIGAAFADRLESGIAISIAVLCHELPHELGDFAVLLSTGLTPKKVLMANFFCACCAFFGLYIGIAISTNETTRQWIFAATAGMFLYVALVNMVPELAKRKSKSACRLFILQNAGLLLGFGCMFLIAVFEHQISFP